MIVSGYTLELYCDDCHGSKWESSSGSQEMFAFDGPKAYGKTRKLAKKAGWILKRNGECICPKCNPKLNSK